MTTHYAYITAYSHALMVLVYPPEVRPPRNLAAPRLWAGYVPGQ